MFEIENPKKVLSVYEKGLLGDKIKEIFKYSVYS